MNRIMQDIAQSRPMGIAVIMKTIQTLLNSNITKNSIGLRQWQAVGFQNNVSKSRI